uniref:ZZ-type zinc finger-containing protein 3 n=1 Tax=Oryzias latipes TaxID=8090 RepID=A0A3P9KAK5_ORYLA
MAASRSSRVTRSSVGHNGLDENFCGRTLRNRSIAQPEESSVPSLPRARSPKKKQESRQESKQESRDDIKQEPRQDGKQQSRQESRDNSRQGPKQESKQDKKMESKQESRDVCKQESRDVCKQESRDVCKQESRDVCKESEQISGHSANQKLEQESKDNCRQKSEDKCFHESEPRQDSRQSVRQDSNQDVKLDKKKDEKRDTHLQDRQQQGTLKGLRNDFSFLQPETDQWTSSSKRGFCCLEKDISTEKSENCDTEKVQRDTSPQIKKAMRFSPSEEPQGQEEAQNLFELESPASVPETSKDSMCEELPRQHSGNTTPASPLLSTLEGEMVGMRAGDARAEFEGAVVLPNPHETSNGLKDLGKAEESSELSEQANTRPASTTNFPLLLNGSQTEAPLSSEPSVPFTNSVSGQMEVSGLRDSPAPSALTCEVAPEEPVPELIVAKEQEVEEMEVDILGDPLCLAHEEQVTESESDANSQPPSLVQEAAASTSSTTNCTSININNSGETTPPLTPPSPTEPEGNPSISSSTSPSFTELYEHRYTLRTSPGRTEPGEKLSSNKLSSPTDNGPLEAEGEVEEGYPPLEDPLCSDSFGPSSEEQVSANPRGGTCDEGSGFLGARQCKSTKELTQSQAAEEEEEEEEPDVYYFESDHVALKHNKDYQRLLQTIGVLEAQRTQAIRDLETLAHQQSEALVDPISFVEKLQKQVNMDLPCPQRVVQLPEIAWEQHTSGLGDFEREFCDKKRKTRQLKLIFDKGLPLRPKSPIELKKEGECSTAYSSLPTSDAPENGLQTQMIRGRICHPNKPDTFNQLWTVEEQKKLEQLLIKFPPEEIESRRWQKIADELGNRTAKQVASRVQKYFIKLTKAGIPVPGRTPNLCMYTKKTSSKRQHHLNKHLYRPSTFLTSYEPPVFMDEDDERSMFYSSVQDPSGDESDDDAVPMELRNLPEYKELLELKRLKKQKLHEIQEDKAAVQHIGFKCDVCGMEPIQGTRWHCQSCPPENSVDFCSNCTDCFFNTETHKPNHHLEPVHQPETFLDRDYCLPQTTGYNYLDPNYFPANR